MTTSVLVTGCSGFLGRNLCDHLSIRDVDLCGFDVENSSEDLDEALGKVDAVFHLAGVNRPERDEDFVAGNAGFTGELLEKITKHGRKPHVLFSSSVQAERDNAYGRSKRQAEILLKEAAGRGEIRLSIFRLPNLFGKWSRPNYNAVTSTFCYNIANDLPIRIDNTEAALELAYVDDVIAAFLEEADKRPERNGYFVEAEAIPVHSVTLGDLAEKIRFFRQMHATLRIPDFSNRFDRRLYTTYLSYVPKERWEYGPPISRDERGTLAELLKMPAFGQMFVSRTRPGVTRGNHYHHTKTEKFIVLAGEAVIRFRSIHGDEIIEFPVKGEDYRIVDIPPGYTHNITNTGTTELITLFWASEIFDPKNPDTFFLPVEPAK